MPGVQAGTGNSFGTLFRVTTFGESHGGGVGCVIDGCPPRIPLSEADMQMELDRRYGEQDSKQSTGVSSVKETWHFSVDVARVDSNDRIHGGFKHAKDEAPRSLNIVMALDTKFAFAESMPCLTIDQAIGLQTPGYSVSRFSNMAEVNLPNTSLRKRMAIEQLPEERRLATNSRPDPSLIREEPDIRLAIRAVEEDKDDIQAMIQEEAHAIACARILEEEHDKNQVLQVVAALERKIAAKEKLFAAKESEFQRMMAKKEIHLKNREIKLFKEFERRNEEKEIAVRNEFNKL
eukprot:Gb_32918 [translate_table: standard]